MLSRSNIRIDNWPVLVAIAIVVKLTFSAIGLWLHADAGQWPMYLVGGDTPNYIEPIENLFIEGRLITHLVEDPFFLRMPGFLPLYLPLRFIFSSELTLLAIVIIQTVLSGVSVYFLSKLAFDLFGKTERVFWLTYVTFLISTYASIYDTYILSESLSTSFTIIALYLLINHRTSLLRIVLAGALMAWCIFLKPYFIAVFVFYTAYLAWSTHEKGIKRVLPFLVAFVLPYAIATTAWTSWNMTNTGEAIWLQKRRGHWNRLHLESNPKAHLLEYVRVFGGQYIAWDPKGLTYAFYEGPKVALDMDRFPDAAFSSQFNRDSLALAKQHFDAYVSSNDSSEIISAGTRATGLLKRAREGYLSEHRLDHYTGARIRCFAGFFFQVGSYNIPFPPLAEQNIFQKLIKLGYACLFWIIMTLGLTRMLYSLFIDRSRIAIFLGAIPGFVLLLFPIILLKQEQRYAVIAFTLLLPFAIDLIWIMADKIRLKLAKR